jgi:hypothetical protein
MAGGVTQLLCMHKRILSYTEIPCGRIHNYHHIKGGSRLIRPCTGPVKKADDTIAPAIFVAAYA